MTSILTAPDHSTYTVNIHWEDQYTLLVWVRAEDGTPCAFAHCYRGEVDDYPDVLVLLEIEVREGYRRRGLTTHIINSVKEITQKELYSFGDRTALGDAALRGKLPIVPGYREEVKHKPLTFVKDWDTMQKK